MAINAIRRWRGRKTGTRCRGSLLLLCLPLHDKVDNKFLVFFYEFIVQPLGLQIVSKIFPPARIESLQNGKLARIFAFMAVHASHREAKVMAVAGTVVVTMTAVAGRKARLGRFGWGRCGRVAMTEEAAEEAVLVARAGVVRAAEGSRPSCLGSVFFPVIHLLLELLRLLLVDERQAGEALFELKGVEKNAVLVVAPCVKDLLIPNDTLV